MSDEAFERYKRVSSPYRYAKNAKSEAQHVLRLLFQVLIGTLKTFEGGIGNAGKLCVSSPYRYAKNSVPVLSVSLI